ncbi:MAG: hypothetical protein ABIQ64_02945 [Candidatus Saccharimonadales bacterium]
MSEYTNRHGKKMRVKDEVVEKIPLGAKKAQPKSVTTPQPSNTTKPIVVSKPKFQEQPATRRWSPRMTSLGKKAALILVGIIAIMLLIGLVTADSTKRDYERQTTTMKRSIFERSKQTSSADTLTKDVVSSLRSSLSAPTDCRVQGIDVASWYGPAKRARVDCQNTAATYKKLQLSLDDMKALAQYIDSVDGALGTALAAQTSGEFAAIGEYRTAWDEGVTALEKITPPEMVRSTHAEIVAKSSAARDGWVALAEANNSRNAESFTAAEKTLSERYSDLRTVSSGLRTLVASTQASINRYITDLSS